VRVAALRLGLTAPNLTVAAPKDTGGQGRRRYQDGTALEVQKRNWAPNSPEKERGSVVPPGVMNPSGVPKFEALTLLL
jgi:hypothetical protein